MSKRFSETDKWKDKWFRGLKTSEKLVFLYLIDNCDLAGFIEIDLTLWSFFIGLDEDKISGAIEGLSRGYLGADNWLWIKNFLKHQKNAKLNPENNAHKSIIGLLAAQQKRFKEKKEFKEILGANKGLFRAPGKGKVKVEVIINKDSPEYLSFQSSVKKYPGSKGGVETEFTNYQKKYPEEWKGALVLIEPAIDKEIKHRKNVKSQIDANVQGLHLAPWKNFSTWINNKCWEQEHGTLENAEAPVEM